MKVAIMVDGGFLKVKHLQKMGNPLGASDVVDFCLNKVMGDDDLTGDDLFRIYYYDCLPFDGTVENPISGDEVDYSETPKTAALKSFCQKLARMPKIAFRSGKLSYDGWNVPPRKIRQLHNNNRAPAAADLKVKFSQKQVDMKIGLDIAWLASKQIVDKIVLVTSDSDFVPAMKFARREGVRVYLVCLNHRVKSELIEHSDGLVQVECGP